MLEQILTHFIDVNDLYEAHHLLENGKVDGILEEMFTAIEFVKEKVDSGLSVAQVLEEKHGYGAAIKKDDFSPGVVGCLPKLMEFVSYDIYSNTSKLLKSVKVSFATVTITAAAVSSDAAAAAAAATTSLTATAATAPAAAAISPTAGAALLQHLAQSWPRSSFYISLNL